MVSTMNTRIGSCHVRLVARKSEIGKFVETHNLTSYLPKFLLVLKDRDGAGVAASTEVVERS